MSAWGGFDVIDEPIDNSSTPVDYEFDLDEVLQKAAADPESVKQEIQKTLIEAAQNGNNTLLEDILGRKPLSDLVNINAKDEAGSTALIYASCFGHEHAVAELLRFGADPNLQDASEWTALMWAANNNHLSIVKQLLAADADTSIKTSTGRSLSDLQMSPSSVTYLYLSSNGYIQSPNPVLSNEGAAFYEQALDPAEVDNQFNNELKESANALGGFSATSDAYTFRDDDSTGTDNRSDAILAAPLRNAVSEISRDFDWETFKVKDSFALPRELIPEYLDLAVTNVVPTLQKNQAPFSANALFLATRYYFYCGNTESFTSMTNPLPRRIELAVEDESHRSDLAYLSYWLTNTEVFLYYLQKDKGINAATQKDLQPTIASLIALISNRIQRVSQNLLHDLIAPCLLDYDSIPEYGKVEYRGEWKLFRGNMKEDTLEDAAQKHMLPPSQETRWKKPGPQRLASVLSSLLLLFQIFGVHSVSQAQIIAKLLYYMTSRMFNQVCTHKRYLNRRRAMQIRLNMSVIEDWCRNHNFRPEAADIDEQTFRYKSLIDIGRSYLAPLNQLLAWLQTFSGFGSDFTNVISTLQELKALNPKQLLQTATHYRFETRESPLSKEYKHYLQDLSRHYDRAAEEAEAKKNRKPEHPSILQKTKDLLSFNDTNAKNDVKPKRIIRSCVLLSYELPIPDDVLLDEELELTEHIPYFEEALRFWGDDDASALVESQGGRFIVPFLPADVVETISKRIDNAEDAAVQAEQQMDDGDLEEPVMASRRPVDGDEQPDDVDEVMWSAADTGLGPVW